MNQEMDHTAAESVLKEVFEILPDAWLFAGTLLGYVREGKILEWDGDIDIGYLSENMTREKTREFLNNGFKMLKRTRLKEPIIQSYIPGASFDDVTKIVFRKESIKVELMCFKEGRSLRRLGKETRMLYYRGGILKQTPRLFALPYELAYPIIPVSMYNFTVNIPQNYKEQLSYIYGNDWEVPKKEWYFTPEHYLCRERTTIELVNKDDGTVWSKWRGRKKIEEKYGKQNFPEDINEEFSLD